MAILRRRNQSETQINHYLRGVSLLSFNAMHQDADRPNTVGDPLKQQQQQQQEQQKQRWMQRRRRRRRLQLEDNVVSDEEAAAALPAMMTPHPPTQAPPLPAAPPVAPPPTCRSLSSQRTRSWLSMCPRLLQPATRMQMRIRIRIRTRRVLLPHPYFLWIHIPGLRRILLAGSSGWHVRWKSIRSRISPAFPKMARSCVNWAELTSGSVQDLDEVASCWPSTLPTVSTGPQDAKRVRCLTRMSQVSILQS